MKRCMLLLVLVGLAEWADAQVFIQGQPIPDSCLHLTVSLVRRAGRRQARLEFSGRVSTREERLTDGSGAVLEFDSESGLFDYLDRQGWEYLDSFTYVGNGIGSPGAYLFRRKRPKP